MSHTETARQQRLQRFLNYWCGPLLLQLDHVIRALSEYTLLLWDEDAAARFMRFRAQGIRIGTLDLRIACITLEYDATLLTRNTVDFAKVPGLRIENWLD